MIGWFWKTHAPTEQILCSSDTINTYSKYSQPDNIFDIKKINTAYSFITQILNTQIGIYYRQEEEKFWLQLLAYIKDSSFSFKGFVNKHLNVYELKIENILNKWTSSDATEFQRWLLKHYYLQFIADNKYLNKILYDCVDYSELKLFREIAISIFVDTNSQSQIKERNMLLNLFSKQYKLPKSDLLVMKKQILNITKTDINKAVSLCSGRFDFEKELLVVWYKDKMISLKDLQNIYPDFAAYMNDLQLDCWINTYTII